MTRMFDRVRYAGSELIENATDPEWVRGRIRHRVNGAFQTKAWPRRSGVNVPVADWDVFVLFDACRPDTFETVVDTTQFDEYTRVTSQASQTHEWLSVNWTGEYGDVVYVAGNPMVSANPPAVHHLDETWRDAFDDEMGQVNAETITDRALALLDSYPNKRLVVHYMQPHAPFIGHPELRFTEWELINDIELEGRGDAADVWEAGAKGLVEEDAIWEGYADNLEYVWERAGPLLDATNGRRVAITSDHGNVIKTRDYPIPITISAHPPNHRQPGLVSVPWGVLEADGERPNIVAEDATSEAAAADEEVEERLRALGYA